VTAVPGWVTEPCDPYPSAPNAAAFDHYPDVRRVQWMRRVLGQLDRAELEDLARTLATLHPRAFEQDLLHIQRSRDWARSEAPVTGQ